jgi:hypothetical protein
LAHVILVGLGMKLGVLCTWHGDYPMGVWYVLHSVLIWDMSMLPWNQFNEHPMDRTFYWIYFKSKEESRSSWGTAHILLHIRGRWFRKQ